jgi:hypothetical protein
MGAGLEHVQIGVWNAFDELVGEPRITISVTSPRPSAMLCQVRTTSGSDRVMRRVAVPA